MKVHFVVALVGSAISFALSAFADEAPTAASSTQAAIAADSDSSTGHPAITDHDAKQSRNGILRRPGSERKDRAVERVQRETGSSSIRRHE